MSDDERDRTVRQYRPFAEVEAVETSPLYAELAAAVADDDRLLDFLLELPAPKRRPNLLLAAVAFLHGTPAGPTELRSHVRDDGKWIRATMLARFTQANEPGRCAALVATLTAVLVYLERPRREEFVALVRSLGVRWIAQEAPDVVPGPAERVVAPGRFVLSLDGRPLAVTAPHGGRVEWLPGG